MGLLTRESLLQPAPRRYQEFQLPDGRSFRLQSLTEAERMDYELSNLGKDGRPDRSKLQSARRRLVCMTLVDAQGNRVFSLDDELLLKAQDGSVLEAVFQAACRHCHLNDNAMDVETIAKNSPAVPAASSP